MTSNERPSGVRQGLLWINMLGLDAVAVAMVWLAVFSAEHHARMRWENYATLAAGVWCFYILDRVMDGFAGHVGRPRHQMARRSVGWLLPLLLLAAAGGIYLGLYRIRQTVMETGLMLALFSMASLAISWLSRKAWPGKTGAMVLGGALTVGLMQGVAGGAFFAGAWRAVTGGLLFTVLWMSLRMDAAPAPWTLPRKMLTGWIFAMGVALAPVVHVSSPMNLPRDSVVLLFAAVCTLNTLGICLWERSSPMRPQGGPDIETALLTRLYPVLAAVVCGGAAIEWVVADRLARPPVMACGAAACCFGIIHFLRARIPACYFPILADGILIICGLAALLPGD